MIIQSPSTTTPFNPNPQLTKSKSIMNNHSKIVTLAAVAVITAALSQAAWSRNFAQQEQGAFQHGGRSSPSRTKASFSTVRATTLSRTKVSFSTVGATTLSRIKVSFSTADATTLSRTKASFSTAGATTLIRARRSISMGLPTVRPNLSTPISQTSNSAGHH